MARKRRRGGRRGFRVGKYVNLGFKVFGIAIALSPSFRGLKTMSTGDFEGGTRQIAYDYVGIDNVGTFHLDRAAQGLGTVVAGILVGKLGGIIGRQF